MDFFPSIPFRFAAESAQDLAQQFCREDGQRQQGSIAQFPKRQWGGAQDRAAEVDEQDLYQQNSGHDAGKAGVFGQPCQRVETIGTGVEAVENRSEDERRRS